MSIMAAQRARDRHAGARGDRLRAHHDEAAGRPSSRPGIRVVATAGGGQSAGLSYALARVAAELQVPLRIGVAPGDDLGGRTDEFRSGGMHRRDVQRRPSGRPPPA
jgi:hypothetical protein